MSVTSATIEDFLRSAFEANFERLREETGNMLTPESKIAAREQVLLYYRRLRALAESVTETEVRLTLPEQQSPAGRRYTLEGVVDIVREQDTTVMYDIKTYLDAEAAQGYIEPHYRQLSVYAHIWQTLRAQPLDQVAVIATRPTPSLRYVLSGGDPRAIERAIQAWQPVLELKVQEEAVAETVADFGRVVDAIEEHRFAPPAVDVLRAPSRPGGKVTFGTDVCVNCDARFSCDSYRQFALRSAQGQRPEAILSAYFADFGSDPQRDEWLEANLPTADHGVDLGD